VNAPTAQHSKTSRPPWLNPLVEFYRFLGELEKVWHGLPELESSIIYGAFHLLHPPQLPLPLRAMQHTVNCARGLLQKPPVEFYNWLKAPPRSTLQGALGFELLKPYEQGRANRLAAVFSRYTLDQLRRFTDIIEVELGSYDNAFFSDNGMKRQIVSVLIVCVGAASAWSALMASLLGVDLAAWVENQAGFYSGSAFQFSRLSAWGISAAGALAIAVWGSGRYEALQYRHRLHKIRRYLKLYILSTPSDFQGRKPV